MSATIRYIGNYDFASSNGKFLWEILAQMPNFGVGRVVTKNEWLRRYPTQPSYCIIRRVRPEMDRWLWKGTMLADWVYRGRPLGVYEFGRDLNRSDWRLIYRHEEAEFTKPCMKPFEGITMPTKVPRPPLQIYFSKRRAAMDGREWDASYAQIPMDVCIDPEFEMFRDLFKQSDELNSTKSIYDIDPNMYLELYGEVLPTKIDAWSIGPAKRQAHIFALVK